MKPWMYMFDVAWVAWVFFTAASSLAWNSGFTMTRTDIGSRQLQAIFAALCVLVWPILRVYVL